MPSDWSWGPAGVAIILIGGSCVAVGWSAITGWRNFVRRLKVLWFIRSRVFASFGAVYGLGVIPIGIHLFAVATNLQNGDTSVNFANAVVADAYLYAFIVSLAGLVDALAAGDSGIGMVLLLLAFASLFGNFSAQLNAVNGHSVMGLVAIPASWVLGICLLGYGWYKLLSLLAAASEEWEQAEQKASIQEGREG